jgi:hypothetical protein
VRSQGHEATAAVQDARDGEDTAVFFLESIDTALHNFFMATPHPTLLAYSIATTVSSQPLLAHCHLCLAWCYLAVPVPGTSKGKPRPSHLDHTHAHT